MGRHRKPKAQAELDGTFEKHPERRKNYEQEPKPVGPLGEPPASFNPEMSAGAELIGIWNEIVSQAPAGVLTSSDRLHVELCCRMYYRIRHGTAKSGDYNSVRELLGKMAMNPADRSSKQFGVGGGPAPQQTDAGKEKPDTMAQLAAEARTEQRPN